MEPAGPARVERRLAAILAADVAGYSRLIEADEEGTLRRLKVSGDPEQDYFVDGMVEEIITALSRIRWLFVIAAIRASRTRDKPPM
jgi:hypothetical protein